VEQPDSSSSDGIFYYDEASQTKKISDDHVSEYQTIPLNKKQYYSLDITYFKSSLDSHLLDLLWNKKDILFNSARQSDK
uniref:COP9 signalosome complex subunit 5b (Fragments) n=1 Tax=Brassica oleracea TaxID=3712 RepID=CSN5B_BRAOL|nr:RecName: Full=COP9 signalosome complex subunit 5b; Short=Signalosome subunit 5b; AltName: Full=Jun activation domain-binding homolog 1 [Brassica oleracea]